MTRMFSNADLRKMIVPLFFEQMLILIVGMADTFIENVLWRKPTCL